MNKKRIGVITFHNYDNYGAILQSYALQKKLRELGTYPEIIDYSCQYISNPFRLINLKEKGLFNYIYGAIGHICYIPRRRKCNQFRKHMKYSEKGKKKCSYAASIGEHIPPEQFRNDYSRLLNDFDEILVREDYGADIVNELTGKKPEVVCDPTLLLTADEWNKLLKEPKIRGKYILVYQLGINPEIVNFARRLKKETGYRIVYIPFPLVGLLKCRCEITVGPAEWMGLFKNAEYVISDSFHGVVFSLLFNRKFFAKADGHHKNRRVEQLLKLVNLSDRTMNDVSDEQLTEEIDFTYANEQIANFRNFSLHKLSEMVK